MEPLALPPFYYKDPAIWFARVEAVFALNCITSDIDKYNHVLAELNCDRTSLVKDVILGPASENKYQQFKTELLRRMAINQLKKEEIGNRKPSEFYKYLSDKAYGNMSKDIYKIWLEKLPTQIQDVILHTKDSDNEAKCSIADEVSKLLLSNTNIEKKGSVSECFSVELKASLNEVLMKLKNIELLMTEKQNQCKKTILKLPNASIDKNTSNGKETILSKNRDEPSDQESEGNEENDEKEVSESPEQICWYHKSYGEKAYSCVSPCHYKAPES